MEGASIAQVCYLCNIPYLAPDCLQVCINSKYTASFIKRPPT